MNDLVAGDSVRALVMHRRSGGQTEAQQQKKPGGTEERLRARESLESEQQFEDTGLGRAGLSSERWNCGLHRKFTPDEKDAAHGEHRMPALRQNIRRLVR